jgi:hypothetical protein
MSITTGYNTTLNGTVPSVDIGTLFYPSAPNYNIWNFSFNSFFIPSSQIFQYLNYNNENIDISSFLNTNPPSTIQVGGTTITQILNTGVSFLVPITGYYRIEINYNPTTVSGNDNIISFSLPYNSNNNITFYNGIGFKTVYLEQGSNLNFYLNAVSFFANDISIIFIL